MTGPVARFVTLAATAALLPLAAGGAAAQIEKAMTPVTLGKAEDLAKACVGKTGTADAAERKLIASGWTKATGGGGDLRLFARDGVMLLLSPIANTAQTTCIEMIKLAQPTPGSELYLAMNRAFGVEPVQASDGQPIWVLGDEFAAVSSDNANSVTGLRIMVAPKQGEGKK